METFQEKVNFRELDWHPRVKVLQYYSAVISDTPSAVHVSAPHIRQVLVEEWRRAHPNSASKDGVPLQGRLDSNFDPVIERRNSSIDDGGAMEDGGNGHDVLSRRATRRPVYTSAYSQRLQQSIEGILPAHSPHWQDYCVLQTKFLEQMNRIAHPVPGPGSSLRIRGIADVAQGRGSGGSRKRNMTQPAPISTRVEPIVDSWQTTGLKGSKAHRVLEKGAADGWILEVHPNTLLPTYTAGDRWFLKIMNGSVVGLSNCLKIKGCRWLQTNSVTKLCPDNQALTSIEIISMVIAYGPVTAPMFANVATTSTVVVLSSTDSSSDSSSDNGMITLSKFQAQARKRQAAEAVSSQATTKTVQPMTVWKKGIIGWKDTRGAIAFGSERFCLSKKSTSVELITYPLLRAAMIDAKVPGTESSSNKDQLIKLMCTYNCEYTQHDLPSIRLASSQAPPTEPDVHDATCACDVCIP
jgi:hypothetical protein